jgi:hypothetical protein
MLRRVGGLFIVNNVPQGVRTLFAQGLKSFEETEKGQNDQVTTERTRQVVADMYKHCNSSTNGYTYQINDVNDLTILCN